MGFGILEPNTTGHVPGTVLLDQKAAHSELQTGQLKHGTGKYSHIILAPQPSEDPNDPLNWSWWKKHIILAIIFFGTIVHGVVPGPLLNAGIVEITADLGRSATDVAKLSGYLLLATGAVGPFASSFGRKYGKRPAYVFSSVIGTVGIIVSEVASDYNTLLAGRVLQGISVAAYESLAVASIGDLFFVHERGPMVAIIMFLLGAVSNGISIIAGVITANLGWNYNFHIYVPFAAVQTLMVIFYCPETMYRRKAIYEIDTLGSEENLEKLAGLEARAARHVEDRDGHREVEDPEKNAHVELGAHPDGSQTDQPGNIHRTTTAQSAIPLPKTYWQELALYNGSFVDDSIIKMTLACLAIVFNLGALYQIIMTGLIIAWYVTIAIISGIIFASPPYLLTSASIGYLSAGPLVGGLLGSVVSFFLSGPLTQGLTRRNKGVYEPEFCLIPIAPGAAIMIAGLVGWGFAVHTFANIYVICFIWGLLLFGIIITATFATQWALDAYRQHSTELFVMNMVFKNFFYYGLTNYIIDWYFKYGTVQMGGIMAGVTGFCCILALPMYIFGKRYRHYWHHHNIITKLRLETDHTGAE
ncbi:uncharacterized protein A1O9_10466 [Exophiala aquamarina CBS 119918]|uniref:Major facilitator superfamily (MFS) profile domain-containing protein n=1 Tax=Exophiala aquamarina CBS 119918 TaxID=1182545 RepID=A0A072P0W0_9EURO|nr:uncharacterized protein A1O9_10466 [Exophiala aquamarina CBS 119918]KEF53491.1 hypothetical protein A1O9_10466 [Exophiala aquamarina CBS 119918]